MKRMTSLLTFALFMAIVSFIVQAQELPKNDKRNPMFESWFQQVVTLNPGIKDFHKMLPGTVYNLPDGKTDTLQSGDSNGIWGREFKKWYGISYEDFIAGKAVPTPTPMSSPSPPPSVVVSESSMSPLWFLLLLLLLPLIGFLLYKKSPTRWRPMVAGGVDDARALELLNRQATRSRATVVPGSQERVRLYGIWGTQHRGIPIPIPHDYDGERAWRARFRMPDGIERVGYMLQGCGNDVSAGAWYVRFPGARVEEGWGDESPATVSPVIARPRTEPAVRITTPTATQSPISSVEETTRRFVSFVPANGSGPNMLRWHGIDLHSLDLEPDGTRTLRFK